MAGIGDSWGTREELLHPRDKHGRFRSKWKMAEGVVNKILAALAAFNPRTFQSDGQAAQYLHNKAKPGRFGGGQGYARLSADYHASQDALRAGTMDTSTKKFVDMMDASAIELPDDIIASRRVGPEAFGLTPETMHLEEGGIEDATGKLMADRGYSSMNIGNPMGTGPILVTVAVPKGTKVIIPARSQNDRQLYGDRDQEIRITKVSPDGRGGYYVLAVAQPPTPGETPTPIGGPGKASDVGPREGQVLRGQELQAKSQKINPDEPLQQRAPQPGDGGPSPQGPVDTGPGGPPPRNEPVVSEAIGTGGAPQAATPPAGTPETPGGAPETPIREADFKEAAAALPIPSAGKRRREWNQAYLGVRSGKRDPDDILRELNKDIEVNKADLADKKSRGDSSDPQLADDIQAQEKLADLIGKHHGIDGKTSEEAPAAPEPVKAVKKAAPVKKVAAPAKKAAPAKAEPAERRMTLAEAKRRTALDAVRENPIDDPSADTTYKRISKGLEDGTMTVPQARKQALDSARYFHGSATTVGRNGQTTPEKRGAAHASETAKATKYEQLAEALQLSQGSLKTDKYRRAGGADLAKKAVPEALPAKKAPAPKKSVEGAAPGTAAGKITSARLTPGTTVLIQKDSSGAWRPTTRKTGATKLTVTGNDATAGGTTSIGAGSSRTRRRITGTGPDGEKIQLDVAPSQTFIVDSTVPKDFEALVDTTANLPERPMPAKLTPGQRADRDAAADARNADILEGTGLFPSVEAELADIRDRLSNPNLTRQERLDIESRLARINKTQSRSKRPVTDDEILGMTKPELIAEAKRQGVRIHSRMTKKDLQDALRDEKRLDQEIGPPTPDSAQAQAAQAHAEGLDVTVPELKRIAATEGVTDYKNLRKADLQAKIRAHREQVANRTPEDQAIIDSLGSEPTPGLVPATPTSIMQRISSFDNPPTREEAHELLKPLMKRDLVAMANDLSVPGAQGKTKKQLQDEIVEATTGRRLDSIATRGFRGARPGDPDPVVANPVAQKPIQAPDRVADFRLAWTQGGDGFKATGSAGRQLDEIRDDIGTGKITPDEGIRRLETEIGFNKDELAEMDADLRGDMGEEQRHLLKQKRDALAKGVATQEKASTFLRTHFKKEPLATPDEVAIELNDDAKQALDAATPDGLRKAAKAQGITVKGETKEEILKDLVRQMAGKELERRAAEKKAPAPKAPDKPKPDLETSPYQRIDSRALAEGLDLRTAWDQKMLDGIQAQLDGGDTSLGKNPTPAQIGRALETWANGPAGPFYRAAVRSGLGDRRDRSPGEAAEIDADASAFRAQGTEWLKLADRLKNTRRRKKEDRAPDVTPKVTKDEKKDIARVAEVTGLPVEQLEAKALEKKKAEAPPKQSAVQVAETLKTVGSREEAKTLLQGRTKAELTEIAKASGVSYGTRDTKPTLIDRIVQFKVGRRLDSGSIATVAMPGDERRRRAELEDMPLSGLVDLEEELGIQRTSLNRGDRIQAILDKQHEVRAAPTQAPPAPVPDVPAKQGAAQIAEQINSMKNSDEARDLLKGRTKKELVDILKALGSDPREGSKATRDDLVADITGTVSIRSALRGDVFREGHTELRSAAPTPKPVAKPAGPPLRSAANITDLEERGGIKLRDRPGNDEPVLLPNGGQDQGNMHLDSEMGQLWQELYADDREPNSFVNEIARMGDRMGTRGDADLENDVIPMLERLRDQASDSVVEKRIQRTIDSLSAPPAPALDLPEGIPAPLRAAMEQLARIPTARKTGRLGAAFAKESVLDKKAKLIRDFVNGDIGFRDFEFRLQDRDLHESADGAFRMWTIFEQLFNSKPIIGYRTGPGGKSEAITRDNPDADIVRDWIRATRKK